MFGPGDWAFARCRRVSPCNASTPDVPARRMSMTTTSRTAAAAAVAGLIALSACGSTTAGPASDASQSAPDSTPATPATTAVSQAVKASPTAATKAACAAWEMVAPQIQSDADAHQNADLYTDTGNSQRSDRSGPFGVTSDDGAYASQSFQDALKNLSTTVRAGDGSDASFQADIAAASRITRVCDSI